MVADSVSEEDQDAAFSLYFFLGFFSAPVWTIVTGYLFQTYSFTVAFTVMSTSFVGAMAVLNSVQDIQRPLVRHQR